MDSHQQVITRVLVVGAGPVGLSVAAALSAQGIVVDLIDKRATASPYSRAFGLEPVTLELLNSWGLAEEIIRRGIVWAHAPLGDKAGRTLSFSGLPCEYPYMVIIPQSQTESVLTAWAERVGVNLRRSCRVCAVRERQNGVEVILEHGDPIRQEHATYDWVLGADGVNSTVRQQLDIPFSGQDYPHSLMVADVLLEHPPSPAVHARSVSRGLVALFPLPDGSYRVSIEDHARMDVPVEQPVTYEEIADSMWAILGQDFGLSTVLWSARYRSKQRLAARYRQGSVFLLGDAAHTHVPAGGQGLQMGIGDAANLAWKLAGVIQGRLPSSVLESYESERRPLAAAALRNTDLLFRFNTASGPAGRLLHWLGLQATRIPYVARKVVSALAGEDVQYRSLRCQRDHRLVGRRLPRLLLQMDMLQDEPQTLSQLLRLGRFVLIHHQASGLADELQSSCGCLCIASISHDSPYQHLAAGKAILVRPDGIVLWVGSSAFAAKERLALWLNGMIRHEVEN
ncbi:FAD-dependent monooxygenase [Serratia rubidaea]|uniref:FAD-dependent monooxygenase n=1 Tax=Serratia rubidaea TaxID=61652 RepID=UPI0022B8BF93|nr:FAD-dependent monooxygenase [Serratia rubidaea]WBF45737.1 FAD-dependent monooxygenase [Serratia rubidaea]